MNSSPSDPPPPRLVNPEPIIALLQEKHELSAGTWTEADLPDIWQHQLAVPVSNELVAVDPAWGLLFSTLPVPPDSRFVLIFSNPLPPLRLLELVKEYAKAHLNPEQSLLPLPIARALFVATVVRARVDHGARISTMSDRQLQAFGEALVRSEWLDASSRDRIADWMRQIVWNPVEGAPLE